MKPVDSLFRRHSARVADAAGMSICAMARHALYTRVTTGSDGR